MGLDKTSKVALSNANKIKKKPIYEIILFSYIHRFSSFL